jgi:CheY-like chemotaxis protein
MDGFRLAQQLRRHARFRDILLIAITGYGDSDHRLLWEKAFDVYLVKPVKPLILEVLLTLEHDRLVSAPAVPAGATRKGQGV